MLIRFRFFAFFTFALFFLGLHAFHDFLFFYIVSEYFQKVYDYHIRVLRICKDILHPAVGFPSDIDE